MRRVKCAKCGAVFDTDNIYQYLCDDCRATSSTVMRMRTCKTCGKEFLGGPRAWYCPDCRAERKKEQQKKQHRLGAARPIGSTDICSKCGQPYIVTGGLQKYCPQCAAAATAENARVQKRKYRVAHLDLYDKIKQTAKNRKVCIICGKPIPPGQPTVTCSPECAAKNRSRWWHNADVKRSPRNRKLPK